MIFGNKVAVLQIPGKPSGNTVQGIIVDAPQSIYLNDGVGGGVGTNDADREKLLSVLQVGTTITFLKSAIIHQSPMSVKVKDDDDSNKMESHNIIYVKICEHIIDYSKPSEKDTNVRED